MSGKEGQVLQEDAGSEGRWAPHSGSMGEGALVPGGGTAEELQEPCPEINTGALPATSAH